MNRICILKATKRILGMQSGGDDIPELMEMRLSTLKQNAINTGYSEDDIEVKWVTDAEYEAAKAEDPNEIARIAEAAAEVVRAQSYEQYKSLIRRRADKLLAENKPIEALLLLKTIGE